MENNYNPSFESTGLDYINIDRKFSLLPLSRMLQGIFTVAQ